MKLCNKCDITKYYKDFSSNTRNKDGLQSYCRDCNNAIKREYGRTKTGVISRIYETQRTNSNKRGHGLVGYTKQELINWIDDVQFDKLYNAWVLARHSKGMKPSIDRKDDSIGYELDNIQLMTWQENKDKHHRDVKSGIDNRISKEVVQYDKYGTYVETYYSVSEAHRKTNIDRKSIMNCIRGKAKQAGGFQWTDYMVGKLDTQIENRIVVQYDADMNEIARFNSVPEAVIATDICESNIAQACTGKRKTAGGFKWEYKTIIGDLHEFN